MLISTARFIMILILFLTYKKIINGFFFREITTFKMQEFLTSSNTISNKYSFILRHSLSFNSDIPTKSYLEKLALLPQDFLDGTYLNLINDPSHRIIF